MRLVAAGLESGVDKSTIEMVRTLSAVSIFLGSYHLLRNHDLFTILCVLRSGAH